MMKQPRLVSLVMSMGALVVLAMSCHSRPPQEDEGPAVGIVIDATNFPDDQFRAYLLEQDFGKDSILTAKEQEDVRELCFHGDIRSLQGIERFTHLEDLRMGPCTLGELTLPPLEQLYRLFCIDCQLTELDVSQCPNLVELKCTKNQLTRLDLSHLPKLEQLYAGENRLSEIVLEGTDSLFIIDVQQNQLTQFDLSKQKQPHCIFIAGNPMDAAQLDGFLSQLPEGVDMDQSWSDHIQFEEPYISLGERTLTDQQKQVMTSKRWTRYYKEEDSD